MTPSQYVHTDIYTERPYLIVGVIVCVVGHLIRGRLTDPSLPRHRAELLHTAKPIVTWNHINTQGFIQENIHTSVLDYLKYNTCREQNMLHLRTKGSIFLCARRTIMIRLRLNHACMAIDTVWYHWDWLMAIIKEAYWFRVCSAYIQKESLHTQWHVKLLQTCSTLQHKGC